MNSIISTVKSFFGSDDKKKVEDDEKKIEEKKKEIDDLKKQIDNLKSKNDKKESDELKRKIEQLEKKNSEQKKMQDKFESELLEKLKSYEDKEKDEIKKKDREKIIEEYEKKKKEEEEKKKLEEEKRKLEEEKNKRIEEEKKRKEEKKQEEYVKKNKQKEIQGLKDTIKIKNDENKYEKFKNILYVQKKGEIIPTLNKIIWYQQQNLKSIKPPTFSSEKYSDLNYELIEKYINEFIRELSTENNITMNGKFITSIEELKKYAESKKSEGFIFLNLLSIKNDSKEKERIDNIKRFSNNSEKLLKEIIKNYKELEKTERIDKIKSYIENLGKIYDVGLEKGDDSYISYDLVKMDVFAYYSYYYKKDTDRFRDISGFFSNFDDMLLKKIYGNNLKEYGYKEQTSGLRVIKYLEEYYESVGNDFNQNDFLKNQKKYEIEGSKKWENIILELEKNNTIIEDTDDGDPLCLYRILLSFEYDSYKPSPDKIKKDLVFKFKEYLLNQETGDDDFINFKKRKDVYGDNYELIQYCKTYKKNAYLKIKNKFYKYVTNENKANIYLEKKGLSYKLIDEKDVKIEELQELEYLNEELKLPKDYITKYFDNDKFSNYRFKLFKMIKKEKIDYKFFLLSKNMKYISKIAFWHKNETILQKIYKYNNELMDYLIDNLSMIKDKKTLDYLDKYAIFYKKSTKDILTKIKEKKEKEKTEKKTYYIKEDVKNKELITKQSIENDLGIVCLEKIDEFYKYDNKKKMLENIKESMLEGLPIRLKEADILLEKTELEISPKQNDIHYDVLDTEARVYIYNRINELNGLDNNYYYLLYDFAKKNGKIGMLNYVERYHIIDLMNKYK